jgi:hypothetical protein
MSMVLAHKNVIFPTAGPNNNSDVIPNADGTFTFGTAGTYLISYSVQTNSNGYSILGVTGPSMPFSVGFFTDGFPVSGQELVQVSQADTFALENNNSSTRLQGAPI